MLTRARRLARAHPRLRARLLGGLQWGVGLGLLALSLWWVEPRALLTPLRHADLGWLALALVLSIPMMGLMAVRWSFTARRMGVALPLRVAWRDYYVSVLLNSVLPGGIAGDVVRVARQSAGPERTVGPVARSVVVERMVGQLVLWSAVLPSAALWGLRDVAAALLLGVLSAVVGVAALVGLSHHPRLATTRAGRLLIQIREELGAALWGTRALAVQLSTSLGSLLALVGMFHCCARAIGCTMTPAQTLLVVPGILVATSLPLTVGGWGIRELSAMALFELAAIPAAQGAASSVLYGAVCLVCVLPGLVPLLRRTADPRPHAADEA